MTPLHNISVSMALPPWLTGSGEEELVAHQLLGSQGRRELTLHAAGAGWVEVRLDALITGTVVVVSRSALPSSAAGAQPPLKADDGEASPTEQQEEQEQGEVEGYDYQEDGAWSGPDGRHEEL